MGCAPTASGTALDGGTASPDANAATLDTSEDLGPPQDAPADLDAGSSSCAPSPSALVGTEVGSAFADFTLPRCDGTPYTFYDGAFCEDAHRLTVVSFAALWCSRCQTESAQLSARVTEAYRARGVRVVQVLADGNVPGRAFTGADCQSWVDTFGLTNDELMDVGGLVTSAFYPTSTFPSAVIVDAEGIIRYREIGAADGLPALTAALDSLLAVP